MMGLEVEFSARETTVCFAETKGQRTHSWRLSQEDFQFISSTPCRVFLFAKCVPTWRSPFWRAKWLRIERLSRSALSYCTALHCDTAKEVRTRYVTSVGTAEPDSDTAARHKHLSARSRNDIPFTLHNVVIQPQLSQWKQAKTACHASLSPIVLWHVSLMTGGTITTDLKTDTFETGQDNLARCFVCVRGAVCHIKWRSLINNIWE
jgi:hypothetical protein